MRREDWPEKLSDYLNAKRSTPFTWGSNDCAAFACGAVLAMTDQQLEIPVVESAEDYATLLHDEGSLSELVTRVLGESIHPAYAQRGDVVVLNAEDRDTLGICVGEDIAGPGLDGLVLVPMSLAVAAWRV